MGSGHAVSLAELLGEIEAVSGRALRVERQDVRAVDVPETCLDTERLRDLTGWRPATDLRAGLESTWRWLLESLDRTSGEAPSGPAA